MTKLVADWETLCKSMREVAFQRRATLNALWKTCQQPAPAEEILEQVKTLIQASGIYLPENPEAV